MKKKKILLIDDEKDLCMLTKLNLEHEGEFEVTTAYSGEEGLEKAKKVDFDLILTDFKMPGMSGEDVINELKKIKSPVPIVLFSIYHDDGTTLEHKVKCKADGIISKPIDHDNLCANIKKVLAKCEKKQ